MDSLSHQPHTEGGAYAAHGVESRGAVGAQGFVQASRVIPAVPLSGKPPEQFLLRLQPILLCVSILVTALRPELPRQMLNLFARGYQLGHFSYFLFFRRSLAWLRGGLCLPCACHFTFFHWIRRQRTGLLS